MSKKFTNLLYHFWFYAILLLRDNKLIYSDVSCNNNLCGNHGQCVSLENYHNSVTTKSVQKNFACHCDVNWHGERCDKFICLGRSRSKLSSSFGEIKPGSVPYELSSQCAWLIGNGNNSIPIRLKLSNFSTECSWDNLYIYDGSSLESPLVAVLNGHILNKSIVLFPEIVLHSGFGYLYFSSDNAFNLTGFSITYNISKCPISCGHGRCNKEGKCDCEEGWTGVNCKHPYCQNNCSFPQGDCVDKICLCSNGFAGRDCSTRNTDGYWLERLRFYASEDQQPSILHTAPIQPHLTSAKSVVVGNKMYIVGGYSFEQQKKLRVYVLDLGRLKEGFKILDTSSSQMEPECRFNHAVDVHQSKIYMVGGLLQNDTISHELWCLDLSSNKWSLVTSADQTSLLAVQGHTCHAYNNALYVFFGFNHPYGFVNFVQKFDFASRSWEILQSKGAVIPGIFGHSSVLVVSHKKQDHMRIAKRSPFVEHSNEEKEEEDARVIVLGGLRTKILTYTYLVTSKFYSFNLRTLTWTAHKMRMAGRYLHSSVLIGRSIYIYGGINTSSTYNIGTSCQCGELIAYHIDCNKWSMLPELGMEPFNVRHGHTAVVFNGSMLVYGGFNTFILNDFISYTPASCKGLNKEECLKSVENGVICVFIEEINGRCVDMEQYELLKNIGTVSTAAMSIQCNKTLIREENCALHTDCISCLQVGCVMCGSSCKLSLDTCTAELNISSESDCPEDLTFVNVTCFNHTSCPMCLTDHNCRWKHKTCISIDSLTKRMNEPNNRKTTSLTLTSYQDQCEKQCNAYDDCHNCTKNKCMWCPSSNTCLDSRAYLAVFPYGRCLEWLTESSNCHVHDCGRMKTCSACIASPSCGYCDDASNTGRGTCSLGTIHGPTSPASLPSSKGSLAPVCDRENWYFMRCPLCQCNGYSTCYPNTATCINCQNFTTGKQCEQCIDWYYGHPALALDCQECVCHKESTSACNHRTGKCHCKTRGATSDCLECDNDHKRIHDDCYQVLYLDYMVHFNVTDPFTTRANLVFNITDLHRSDIQINITCIPATNVSMVLWTDFANLTLLPMRVMKSLTQRFTKDDLRISKSKPMHILLHVVDFHAPFYLKVSYYKIDHIDLYKFFVTFFSCFFTLLLIAFILWKFRQRIDMMRRTQRQLQEMEEMAKRPCSSCLLQIDDDASQQATAVLNAMGETKLLSSKQKKVKMVAVALEPLSTPKIAVMSIIIRLPHADEAYTLPCQSGLAFGSALVTMGYQGKKNCEKQTKKKTISESNIEPHLV